MQNAKKWAAIYSNESLISFCTCSGLRQTAIDPVGLSLVLPRVAPLDELGRCLRQALAKSRMLRAEELEDYFDPSTTQLAYEAFVDRLLAFSGSSRSTLFRDMKHCPVNQTDGLITIRPMSHQGGESWGGLGTGKQEYVSLKDDAEDAVLGKSILEALNRCR